MRAVILALNQLFVEYKDYTKDLFQNHSEFLDIFSPYTAFINEFAYLFTEGGIDSLM